MQEVGRCLAAEDTSTVTQLRLARSKPVNSARGLASNSTVSARATGEHGRVLRQVVSRSFR